MPQRKISFQLSNLNKSTALIEKIFLCIKVKLKLLLGLKQIFLKVLMTTFCKVKNL